MGAQVEQTLNGDLNAVIASAVSARVEAEMIKALSGDEVVGKFVTAALQQSVEVKDARGYNTMRVPFMHHVLQQVVQDAAREAAKRLVIEELGNIEEEIRKALRRDVKRIAETMTKSLSDAAGKAYGFDVHVDLKLPANYR